MAEDDITDVLLENKLLFEQLNELKHSERQNLNERSVVEDLLDDEFGHLKRAPYHEIVHVFINRLHEKSSEYEKAIARAIEKEGEVITVKAKLNSVQQHCRIEQMKLEEELQKFKDKVKNDKDRQNLSANEQISLLVQERNTAQANEQALAEKVSELMDEIVRLNEEISKLKQDKLDICLNRDTQNEEYHQLRRELTRISEEDEDMINNLQNELTKQNNRCIELEEEITYLQKRSEIQRQELQTAGDNAGTSQIEMFQYKTKIKDLQDQISIVSRQHETLLEANQTLTTDNQLLAEKFVVLSEKFSHKDETLRDLQRDYKYKIEEVEKLAEIEKEKHDTAELQQSEMRATLINFQTQINSLQAQTNKALRSKAEYQAHNDQLTAEIDILKLDKQEMLTELTKEDDTLQHLLKKQDDQSKDRELKLSESISAINIKLKTTESLVDDKDGQINVLEHNIEEMQKSIKLYEERLLKAQQNSVEFQQRSITAERNSEISNQNSEDIKREHDENLVQLECYEEEINSSKKVLSTIEVFNGTEVKHLYSNISLIDNIERLKEYVLEANQTLRNNKRKLDAISSEVRTAHESSQQLKEKLYIAENDAASLESQLTGSKTHLDSSHREVRQLRETILKGEKSKRVIERRVRSIEGALLEMQNFVQTVKIKGIDGSKAKEVYDSLHKIVQELLKNPDPTKQAIEVELVIDELNVLRSELSHIMQQHGDLLSERDSLSKKLKHEQNWVDKLRKKEETLTQTVDEKNEQLSSVKHELQLRERAMSDKERAFQIRKGELEEEIKTLKKRYKTMTSGEQCGHQNLLAETEQLRHQIQVARNTVQYKEQELSKLVVEKENMEGRLKNSNTEKLREEILKLNIANTRLQTQLSGVDGENEEVSHAEERNSLLSVINQNKVDIEESSRKLYQSELRSETLVTAINELKSQQEQEKERYKRELGEFYERVTTQKEQLARCTTELEELRVKFLETKKQKELAEEEAIRLGERVKQFRESTNVESDKIDRLEKEVDRKTEALATLSEKFKAAQTKLAADEAQISKLNRSVLSLEQTKTTLQLKYSDVVQKYDRERENFDTIKQKLKSRAKNYKQQFEKENSALINKSTLLEEETALLKLHVNKEESWRRTTEQAYQEWRSKNRELETNCVVLEEEVRLQRSEVHALTCTLSARHDEIAALTAELHHVSRTQQHYERMYRTLDMKSRAESTRPDPANITFPILKDTVISSTPLSLQRDGGSEVGDHKPLQTVAEGPAESLAVPETRPVEEEGDDVSQCSGLTLEEEGLNLDDPNRPEESKEKLSGGIIEEPITLPSEPPPESTPTDSTTAQQTSQPDQPLESTDVQQSTPTQPGKS